MWSLTPVSLRSSSGQAADPSPAATVLDEPEELPPPPAALAPLLLAKGKDAQRRGGARDEPASSAETGGGETGVCDICGEPATSAVRDIARAAVLDGHDVSWRDAAPNYILSPGRPAGRTVAAKNTRGSATCPRCRDLAEMRAARKMHRQDNQELEPSEGPSIAERRAERKARQARAAAEVAAREEQERKVRHTLLPCSAELLES